MCRCVHWKVSRLISLSTRGPWKSDADYLSVCLPPYLSNARRNSRQREHRTRREAEGQHKGRTMGGMKENRFMCIQEYWWKREHGGKTEMERKRFILWLIILTVSLRSAEERELWEPEEYTKTPAQYTRIHNRAAPQRLMKVWAAVFLKVHWIPLKFWRQG